MNKNYYAILPASVRYAKNLPAAAKLFYAEITALTNAAGYCYASNKYFTDLYAVSERTVRNWLAILKEEKLVTIKILKDAKGLVKERRIYLVSPEANNFPTPQANNFPTPGAKNCLYNNIGVNNIESFINNKTDTKNLNKELKEKFITFYDREKPAPYYWTAKDAGGLTQLINKIRATLKSTNQEINEDQIITSFEAMLQTLSKDPNSWLYKNLSIPLINSKFNEILSNYGNQQNIRTKGHQLINDLYRQGR